MFESGISPTKHLDFCPEVNSSYDLGHPLNMKVIPVPLVPSHQALLGRLSNYILISRLLIPTVSSLVQATVPVSLSLPCYLTSRIIIT